MNHWFLLNSLMMAMRPELTNFQPGHGLIEEGGDDRDADEWSEVESDDLYNDYE